MTISSISGLTSSPVQPPGSQNNFRQTFNLLVTTLNSADLSGAQQAFSTLGQIQGGGQGPLANSKTPFAKALGQIGQALQNNDLAGAQQALSTLPPGLARLHGHHGHQGVSDASTSSGAPGSSGAAGSSSGANGLSPSGNTVDVTV